MLLSSSVSYGQSREQTAAFIEGGGIVDVGQMKQIDDRSISVPAGRLIGGMFRTTPATTLETVDKDNCIFQVTIPELPGQAAKYYFGNVIVDEINIQRQATVNPAVQQYFWLMKLTGEKEVYCGVNGLGTESGCRTYVGVVIWDEDAVRRVQKAIQYLYSTYCTAAKRKNAF